MPEEIDWLAVAKEELNQRHGKADVAVIGLRVLAADDELLRGHLIKLGAEELVRQAQAAK